MCASSPALIVKLLAAEPGAGPERLCLPATLGIAWCPCGLETLFAAINSVLRTQHVLELTAH